MKCFFFYFSHALNADATKKNEGYFKQILSYNSLLKFKPTWSQWPDAPCISVSVTAYTVHIAGYNSTNPDHVQSGRDEYNNSI